LLAVAVLFGASFFAGLGDISLNRGILFGCVALAGFVSILHKGITNLHMKRRWVGKSLAILIVILIIPLYVFVHELPVARYERVGSHDETLTFIMNTRGTHGITSIGDFPIYYSYYEPFYEGYHNFGDFQNWQSLSQITSFFASPNNDLKLVDQRNIVDWGAIIGHTNTYNEALSQWDSQVYPELDQHYNRVYSSSFETIYS